MRAYVCKLLLFDVFLLRFILVYVYVHPLVYLYFLIFNVHVYQKMNVYINTKEQTSFSIFVVYLLHY